jgi:hypothetical protein
MPTPVISTPSPGYEQISSGVSYSRTLAASNTPTSWAATLPAGMAINNSGVISGAPTATVPTAVSVLATATNADGTSTALTWLIVVLPYVVGLPANTLTRPLNLDANFGTLRIPGAGDPLPKALSVSPASQPLAGLRFADDTAYLTSWTLGERFRLSLGVESFGVLWQIAATQLRLVLRAAEDGPGIPINVGAITATGSGTTARLETVVYLDPLTLGTIVADFENEAATLSPMLLGVRVAASTDARAYLTTATQTIGTLTQSDTEAKTFAVTLTSTNTTPLAYRLTITLSVPSDPGLSCTIVRDLLVSRNGGGTAYVLDSETGPTTDTGAPAVSVNWTTTLTQTSLTATSTGLSVVATATTSAQSPIGKVVNFPATLGSDYADIFVIAAGEVTGTPYLVFYSGASLIGTATLANGDTAADLLTKIATAISETVVAVTYVDAVTIRIVLDSATAIDSVLVNGIAGLTAPASYPPVASYSNTSITCLVEGLEMPDLTQQINSRAVPILIERELTRLG